MKEEKPAGVDIANLVELTAGATVDLRDHPVSPKKGAFLGAGVSLFPKVLDNESAFAKGAAFVRFYFSPIRDVTFAFRAGGEKIWGTFPYYEAAYIGGSSLRAFRSRRFGGDTSAFGSAELRFKLFRPVILLPTDFGLFFFGEAGRVWLDGDSPDDWHTSVGGGMWFAPIYRSLTFSIGAANSTEGIRLTLNGGFAF